MSVETNKGSVNEYVQSFNRGDIEALRRPFTPDALIYGVLSAVGFNELNRSCECCTICWQ